MNSRHSPVGLVSRQWDAVDWACVLCDRRIHNDRASRSANLYQRACPFYSCCAGFYSKTLHYRGMSAPLQPRFGSLRLLGFPKAKIAVESEETGECDGHTVHKLSHRRLTVDWLAPWESDCSRMHSKVSSDWLPSYIKATLPVLEIFKMARYFPDSYRIFTSILYMFRAATCPSSGELIVSIQHLVYVTLYRCPFGVQVWMRLIQTCTPDGRLYRVTYTRCPLIRLILLMIGT